MDKDTRTIDIKLPTRWEDLTQKQLRYLFTIIAQGCSIDGVKEFLEENLGWQFCRIIADSFNDKVFRRNH